MLTEKNFAAALKVMGFTETGGVYEKTFAENVSMSANLKTKKFSYPAQIKNRDRNNFFDSSHKENFVVFECVNRLLDKGYKPEDIMLEKAWHLGHSAKSGRADICVSHNEQTLFIIECKTEGTEFNKEIENLNSDGGQLFSYRQQEQSCQWLVLYASDFKDGALEFSAASVSCHEEIYKSAKTVEEFFKIWHDVLHKPIADDVIFHDETVAYKIGVKPLRKKNLQEFKGTGIVNTYEEILRHNSVTNKQNAFDALLELFICKLADESGKNPDDEVDFQFKFGSDTFETFIDRLQKLYHTGMEEFMRIPTTYTPLSVVENLLFQSMGESREVLETLFKEEFNKLKFYTPNIFNFIKVLNRDIFYINSGIVKEVVDKFKYYKIIGATNLQTLGDLFEQLLDKGFKQDEGQFFTPLPVTRFIWDSLPLEKIISAEKKFALPKIIDYACGAGHFLTQGFEAINDFFQRQNLTPPTYWEDEKLFGIERNDRLSTVSKISLFMHGADKGKIKFGDGLENYPDEGIAPDTFDILVSNPPYSIKNFTQFWNVQNTFDTLDKISISGNEIETLFVERIDQLLKPGGIAAIILPSSILNKDGKSFISAREKILQNFYIRAIAEFGSKTFGATGTKTNILFLEKISDPPKKFQLFSDTVNVIFSQNFSPDWNDEDIFNAWLAKIHVDADTYKKFILREVAYTHWQGDAYFDDYFTAFTKKFPPPKSIKGADLLDWLNLKFYDFAHDIERQKIQYFAQTYTQTTLIISAPDDNAAQEKFLGYTWSNRKGDEGIKISNPGGLLYDPTNRRADDRLAAAVRHSFFGKQISIPTAQNFFYYLNLADMIDFSGVDFTKIIKLSKKVEMSYSGKYPLEKLGKYIVQIRGVSYKPNDLRDELSDESVLLLRANNILDGKINHDDVQFVSKNKVSDDQIIRAGDILMSASSGSLSHVGKSALCTESVVGETFGAFCKIIRVVSGLLPEYIAIYFSTDDYRQFIRVTAAGSNINNLKNEHIDNLKIPVPPLNEQKKIVDAFRAVDADIDAQEKVIAACDTDVKEKFAEMFLTKDFPTKNLKDTSIKPLEYGSGVAAKDFDKKIHYIRITDITDDGNLNENFVSPEKYEEKFILNEGDILFARSGATVGKTFLYKKIFGKCIFAGYLIRYVANREIVLPEYIFYFTRTDYYKNFVETTKKGMSQPNINAQEYGDLQIPIPPKELQEQFAEYVRVAEERKAAAQKRLDELKFAREELVVKYFR